MKRARSRLQAGVVVVLVAASSCVVHAAGEKTASTEQVSGPMRAIQTYCSNMRDLAKDARYRRQFKELTGLAKEVDAKVRELQKKTEEFKKWYALRKKFSEQATEALVKIYSKMRPESAAAQLSAMNKMMAAALIIKLDTRIASAVLNEIEPKKAAALSGIISAAAQENAGGDSS